MGRRTSACTPLMKARPVVEAVFVVQRGRFQRRMAGFGQGGVHAGCVPPGGEPRLCGRWTVSFLFACPQWRGQERSFKVEQGAGIAPICQLLENADIQRRSFPHLPSWKPDKFDIAILRELQQDDARLTNAELASRRVSAAPCWRRVRWLEEAGLHHRLPRRDRPPRKIGLGVLAFVRLDADRNTAEATRRARGGRSAKPEVVACHYQAPAPSSCR